MKKIDWKSRIITERDLIRSVLERWTRQEWRIGKDSIREKLSKLDLETVSAKVISEIIGNDGWTKECCNHCEKSTTPVVVLGEKPGYGSHTTTLCIPCFKKAIAEVSKIVKL